MKKLITDKNLTIINFSIVFYFIAIYLINVYKLDIVIIDVFRELLTIPFLLAQVVFVFLGIYHLVKHKIKILNLVSLIALVISAIYTIGSFF